MLMLLGMLLPCSLEPASYSADEVSSETECRFHPNGAPEGSRALQGTPHCKRGDMGHSGGWEIQGTQCHLYCPITIFVKISKNLSLGFGGAN